jgi:EF hand
VVFDCEAVVGRHLQLRFAAPTVLSELCFPLPADRDGDGEVNEEEFMRIMKKTSLF